jgi:hypothetical protein
LAPDYCEKAALREGGTESCEKAALREAAYLERSPIYLLHDNLEAAVRILPIVHVLGQMWIVGEHE